MLIYHAVLNKPIPTGGFGRRLTRKECLRLRQEGVICNIRWIIVRRTIDQGNKGVLYYPSPSGQGYNHAGCYARLRDHASAKETRS